MYSTRSRSWRREAGPAGPGMGGGGAGNTGEAGASPGSQGRDFPRMRLLPKPFDGGKRAGSGMGTHDGREFTRSHCLMAGIPEARGIGPDQRPGSFPRWVPTSPTCIPGSITLARQRGLGGGFHPSGRSVFTLREEKLRGSNTFLIRTPAGVYNSRSTDITTRRRRGTIVHPLDDLQGVGGSSRCVICFYDPGFVLLHANRSVVTDPVFYPIGTWQ